MNIKYTWAGLAVLAMVSSACGAKSKPMGSACDMNTVCDGVCLVSLPGGMCSQACSDQQTCSKGQCTKIAGGYYCMPSCQADSGCRTEDGYHCVMGACQLPLGNGEPCKRTEDCQAQFSCVQGYCGTPCVDNSGCLDGFFCGEENGVKGCVPDDCSTGTCTRPCQVQPDCPRGTYCGDGGFCVVDTCDENGVCAHPCQTHQDCPQGTYCAEVNGELHCVFVPDDEGPGTNDHSCATENCANGYTCVSRGDSDPKSYCSGPCTTSLDCPPDMVCREGVDSGGTVGNYCYRRDFCEPCDFDGQCGFASQKCVEDDPNVGTSSYCSTACTPERTDTCPLDSTCLEANWCESTKKWVADCSWCTGNCGPKGGTSYQCFKDYGACVGDGSLCAPCHHSGQCSSQGGCLTSASTGVSYCSGPCDSHNRCPAGFFCTDVTGLGSQCVPRLGACSKPSGGRAECDTCDTLMDCATGSCFDMSWNVCLDECTPGQNECPPYTACQSKVDVHQLTWNVCVPTGTVDDCTKWDKCAQHCPNGPTSCDGNEPDYCH